MSNPVIIADLEARFRPLTLAERENAQALLDDAWDILLAVVPDLEDRYNAGTVSIGLLVWAVTAMVLRVMRNPNGVRSWSVDDYSETRDNSLAAGALYVSDAEIALLTGRASSARRGAFSVSTSQATAQAPGSEAEYVEALRAGQYVPPGWRP